MASNLRIPSPLRRFTNGESKIEVRGGDIKQILEELFEAHPDIKGHLVEDDGNLRNFVNIFIEGEDIRQKGGMSAEVVDGSDVRIIPSIAGGAAKLSPKEFIRRKATSNRRYNSYICSIIDFCIQSSFLSDIFSIYKNIYKIS